LVIFYVNENDQDLTPTMQEITRLSDLYIKLDDYLTNYREQADLLDTKIILLDHIDNIDDMSKLDKTLERVENINKEIEHVNDQITATREHLREVTREIEDAETRPE
jgi:predicted  nucleic acid-binding Zn-ribbon protein